MHGCRAWRIVGSGRETRSEARTRSMRAGCNKGCRSLFSWRRNYSGYRCADSLGAAVVDRLHRGIDRLSLERKLAKVVNSLLLLIYYNLLIKDGAAEVDDVVEERVHHLISLIALLTREG